MKKNIWIILFLSITVLLFSQEAMFCGDVNGDNTTNILDALVIAQYYVRLDVNINTEFADVDCNNVINIIDALLVAKKYVGLISIDCQCTGLPCSGILLDQEIDENQDYSFYLRRKEDFELFSIETAYSCPGEHSRGEIYNCKYPEQSNSLLFKC